MSVGLSLANFDRQRPAKLIGRERTLAYYNDSFRSKQRESDRDRQPRVRRPYWHVAAVQITVLEGDRVKLLFDKDDNVSREQLFMTLQFACDGAMAVGGDGLPSLLEATSEDYITQHADGRHCLRLSKRQYAAMTAALLPSYLEPSKRNVKRKQGFRATAMHPILLRYALRKTGDAQLDKWRTWAVIRTLAGYVCVTSTPRTSLDYAGDVYPINSGFFVIYELLPRVLHAIFGFYTNTAAFIYALQETTIVYDIMATFLMPRRIEYINYRLVDEIINLTDLDNMRGFCLHHHMMISEVRKLAETVRLLDDHSRTFIKIDKQGIHRDVNVDLIITTVFNAVCDPRLDRNVAMAMMCSMAISYRKRDSLYAFLDTIPTPSGQYQKRMHDLYTRLTIGMRPCDHQEVGRQMLKDVVAGVYDAELGLKDPPPVYSRPRFPSRYIRGAYATQSFEEYTAMVRRQMTPLVADQPGLRQPLEALYLFVSSFDRNFTNSNTSEQHFDSWDLLTTGMLEPTRLLPLTDAGHYLDRCFFYIYKSARV